MKNKKPCPYNAYVSGENDLPTEIIAYEYTEMCGNTSIGNGILMVDDHNNTICRLTQGTIKEIKIALLWQAAPLLLGWAKDACESERAFYEGDDERTPPSWLAELEAAVKFAEDGDFQNKIF